ncbi:hypothetical protein AL073_05355 [Loktanella sp. 1ANDIMAR09]|nr:hypothetical protein AL073_05355 [Loktanella sp. 1ANDIMAR09]
MPGDTASTGHKADRLILHIGHPKTGTTTLQAALVAGRMQLAQQGIAQPDTVRTAGNAIMLGHHLFGLAPFAINRQGWLNISDRDALDLAAQQWRDLKAQVEAIRARQIVISSEHFFQAFDAATFAHASQILHSLAQAVVVVIYVRAPVSDMLSNLQESVKTPLNRVQRRDRDALQTIITAWAGAFPGAVQIHAFDKQTLVNRDIKADFFGRYLPEADLPTLPDGDLNTSMSAEAMAILHDVKAGRLDRRFDVVSFYERVRRDDNRVVAPTHPAWQDGVAQSINNWCAPDLIWLRDAHCITFPGIDYDALNPGSYDSDHILPARIEDVCLVDPARKARLWRRVRLKEALPKPLQRWAAKW